MKTHISLCIISILFITGCKTPPEPELKISSYNHYFVLTPENYDPQKSWPLILFLHGAGGEGLIGAVTRDIEIFKSYGLGKYAVKTENFPFVVVAPQTFNIWEADPLNDILNKVSEQYNIDQDRIYATGLSMGGFGTFLVATDYPNRFAAIAPIAGNWVPEEACKIKHLPVWIFHNDGDPIVPSSFSQEMFDALEACEGDVKFTMYKSASHDAWTITYNNPEFYAWFLSHRRKNQ